MGAEQLGWFYFDGQLRYKDGHGWTERYKPIDGPGALSRASKGTPSGQPKDRPSPGVGEPRRRTSYLVTALCAGLLGLAGGFGLGAGMFSAEGADGLTSWASGQVDHVSSLFSPTTPSTAVPLAKTKQMPAPTGAAKSALLVRDVNAFAPGGPPIATVPPSYDHPSAPDCLKFRDQVRAWSNFQNAHRPIGFSNDLPSSGDLQYLQTACGLAY
ncbi:MAG: hypothetical protein ABI662_08645 [Dermatophilaceae bacterium]